MSALTRSPRGTITGTVGTTAVTVLQARKATDFLKVHNPSPRSFIAVTYDGVTTPVINGAGTTLAPYGTETCDVHVPIDAVQIIASEPNTPYTIEVS